MAYKIDKLRFSYWVLIIVMWTLSFGTYRPSDRVMPIDIGSVDWIAFAKLVSRVAGFVCLVGVLFRMRGTKLSGVILRRFVPLVLFSCWALISTSWSPLKAFTFGKAFGLCLLTVLGAVAGTVCVDRRLLSGIVFHVSVLLLVFSLANLIGIIGFTDFHIREGIFTHKNEGAQIAGFGLVILLLSKLLFNWDWVRWLVIAAIVVELPFLLLSNSRTSIIMSLAVIILSITALVRFRTLVMLCFPVVFALITMVSLDPTWDVMGYGWENIHEYVTRGQSERELATFTGRTDKWGLVISEFMRSPIIGFGYGVTSPTGYHYLNEKWQLLNAHNAFLSVLSGTGLIGMALFVWGVWRLLSPQYSSMQGSGFVRKRAVYVFFTMMWCFGVGMLELSFLDSVGVPSVVAYMMFGIAAGTDPMLEKKVLAFMGRVHRD